MRYIITVSLAIALVACTRTAEPTQRPTSPASSTAIPAEPAPAVALTCTPPQRVCPNCNGGQFCGIRCPACPPIDLAPSPESDAAPSGEPALQVAGLACTPPLRLCLTCTGQQVCARACPECPAP